MAKEAMTLRPHYGIVDFGFYKINKNLNIDNTITANIASYLKDNSDENDNCPIYKELMK